MSDTNGNGKLRLRPEYLTPADLKRARVALDGRNPWELFEDPLDAMILAIWCLKSRTEPGFTWAQAENTPLGEFDMGAELPPQTPGAAANGGSPGKNARQPSPEKPTGSVAVPS